MFLNKFLPFPSQNYVNKLSLTIQIINIKHIFINLILPKANLPIFYYFYRNYSKMRLKRKEKSIIIEQDLPQSKTPPLKPPVSGLKNIIEVTQQNDPSPFPILSPTQQEKTQIKQHKLSCLRRFTKCIANLWRLAFSAPTSYQIDLESHDLSSIIFNLRNKKVTSPFLLPPQTEQKRVLVLDLDETLIHTTLNRPLKYDFQSQVILNGQSTRIFTFKRFGLDAFLFEMSQLYELVIFTASHKHYADKVIDLIDPKHRISHRLYRQHCVAINKVYYLKNTQSLGRSTADVIIVDDNSITGLLQPDNFYKIDPFNGNQKDRQLYRLSAFLKHLHGKEKVGSINKERKDFEDLEIKILENGQEKEKENGRTLAQRKRQYHHRKTTSQVQELASKSTEDENEAETTASDMLKGL